MVQGTIAPRSAPLEENIALDVLVVRLCRIPTQDGISCMSCISFLTRSTSNALNSKFKHPRCNSELLS